MEDIQPLTLLLGHAGRHGYREESFLDGRLLVHSRDGLHPSERAILPLLPRDKSGRALVVNSRFAILGFALRQLNPALQVVCYFTDAWEADRARQLHKLHPAAGLEFAIGAQPPEGPWQMVVLPLEKQGVADVLREQVRLAAASWIAPGGLLYSSSDNRDDRFVRDEIRRAFGALHMVPEESRKGGVGYVARRPPKQLAAPPRTQTSFTVQEEGRTLTFQSRQGVFCADRLDPGTRALLAVADVTGARRILDLGCGCGVVGVLAAMRAPDAQVVFCDSSAYATDATRRNIENFDLAGRSEVVLSADPVYDLSGHGPFDCILTNPPYYGNWRIAEAFVETARRLLAPKGQLVIVTKSPDWYRDQLQEGFSRITEEKRGGYTVLSARRTGSPVP